MAWRVKSRVLAVVGREVGEHRQRVGVHLAVHVLLDELPRLLDRRPLVAGVLQRPGDVGGDAQHVRVVAIGRAFVDELRVRLPTAVRLLLPASHCCVRWISLRVHVVDLRHVGELHQPVRRQDLVGRRVAEPGEAAARHFEGQQPLIAVGDEALGLGVHLGRQLLRALHVVERQHVGIGARRGLLEAAAGHAQDAVHAFDHLAQRPGIEPDEDLAGVGNGGRREIHVVLHRCFQPAVEDDRSARGRWERLRSRAPRYPRARHRRSCAP